jgi:RNA polymerase sigma-70 factor (ECF subfamily)
MMQDMTDMWLQVHRGLRVFVSRRMANDAEAEDIVQEVFLRMHRRLERLKDPRRVVSWMFQITRHAIADYYRAPERRREVPAGLAVDMDATHPLPIDHLTPASADSGRLREELAACLRPLTEKLSSPYREAVTLVELEGLTQSAAAKRLGLSVSGMKSRVQRGRQRLKRLLEECCIIQLDRRRSIVEYAVRDPQCHPCGAPHDEKAIAGSVAKGCRVMAQ